MRLILSRAGYGKTTEMMRRICRKRGEGKVFYLVVPEQFTLQTELYIVEKLKAEALTDVRVMSFERLSKEVLKKHGGHARPVIDESGRRMVLRRVFEEAPEQLSMYRSAFRKRGFVAEFAHTLSELKKMAVSPAMLEEQAQRAQEPMLRRKLHEVAEVYRRFEEYMGSHYVDNEDRIGLLAEKVSEALYLRDIEMYFDSFSGFTAIEMKVIDQLCRMGVGMNFALSYEESDRTGVFEKTRRTLRDLVALDRKYGIETEVQKIEDPAPRPESLLFLEKTLFDYASPRKMEKQAGELRIYEAMTMEEEVLQTAAEILRLVRQEGYRYRDILVVPTMPQVYASTLDRIFSKYKIPHFVDIKRDILGSGLIAMLFSFLDMMIYELPHDAVFAFLKSGFSDLEPKVCNLLENFCLQWGIDRWRWRQDKFFTEESYLREVEDRESLLQGRDFVCGLFQRYQEELCRPQSVRSHSEKLFHALTRMKIKQKNDALTRLLREEGETDYANETVQIWNVLLHTMDQLVEIMGDRVVSAEEYKNLLEEGLSGQKIGVIPPTQDQVITATMDRSRSADVKALFFLGLNDAYLPGQASESPVFREEDRHFLKEAGIHLPSELHNQNAEENFALYSLIAKPSERLYLSYSLTDSEGKTLRHSSWIDRVLAIFPALQAEGGLSGKSAQEEILSEEYTLDRLGEKLRDLAEQKAGDRDWQSVYHWFAASENEERRAQARSIRDSLLSGRVKKKEGTIPAERLYGPLRLSATRAERFAACPFAHFVDYGLRPKQRKIHEIDALEWGTSLHGVVERFARAIDQEEVLARLSSREECDRFVGQMIEDSLTEKVRLLRERSPKDAYMLGKLGRVAQRASWTLLQHRLKGRFLCYGQEVEERGRPIALPGGGEAQIYGKVDRVDILREERETYVKIIDYKSGSKNFELSDVWDGISLQLICYLTLMMRRLEKEDPRRIIPAGAFYFYLKDVLIQSDSEDPEEIEKEIEKELRMQGVVLQDEKVLAAIDREAAERPGVIHTKIKDKKPAGDAALTQEEFEGLMNRVESLIAGYAERILSGDIAVLPYLKKGNSSGQKEASPCSYCRYAAICAFDEKLGSKKRRLRKRKAEELRAALKGPEDPRGEKRES